MIRIDRRGYSAPERALSQVVSARRFFDYYVVGNVLLPAIERPLAGDVNYRKPGIDLAPGSRNFPAVELRNKNP
jgi:hypothetical protein